MVQTCQGVLDGLPMPVELDLIIGDQIFMGKELQLVWSRETS